MKEYRTLNEAYPHIIRDVLFSGEPSAPRGQAIKEICGYSFKLLSIEDSLPLMSSRKLNFKWGILEGLLNLAGEYPTNIVLHFNKNMKSFMNEETGTWDGAYAPRIWPSLETVYELLKKDPDSRQAVVPIFQQGDNRGSSKDVPCTISLQFLIRDGKLNLIANMRSNDVLWGLAYDVNQFTTIQRALAAWLNIPTGWYIHQAGSMHSYDERESQSFAVVQSEFHESDKYADFKHPSWEGVTKEETDRQLVFLLDTLERYINPVEGVIYSTEPTGIFKTYLDYLTGERSISYAK